MEGVCGVESDLCFPRPRPLPRAFRSPARGPAADEDAIAEEMALCWGRGGNCGGAWRGWGGRAAVPLEDGVPTATGADVVEEEDPLSAAGVLPRVLDVPEADPGALLFAVGRSCCTSTRGVSHIGSRE